MRYISKRLVHTRTRSGCFVCLFVCLFPLSCKQEDDSESCWIDWFTLNYINSDRVFYAKRLGNCVHRSFTYFVILFLKSFFFFCTFIQKQVSFQIQIMCIQFYGFKYSYLIQIIFTQFYGFKCSYLIQIICTELYGFKYSYLIQIIFTQ